MYQLVKCLCALLLLKVCLYILDCLEAIWVLLFKLPSYTFSKFLQKKTAQQNYSNILKNISMSISLRLFLQVLIQEVVVKYTLLLYFHTQLEVLIKFRKRRHHPRSAYWPQYFLPQRSVAFLLSHSRRQTLFQTNRL